MTDRRDLATHLAQSCPAVAADWAVNAADLDLAYVALGHLARRLIVLERSDRGLDFGPLFNDVEDLLATGDVAMRKLLVVGFLEGLHNQAGESASAWQKWLGPTSRVAWKAVDDLWAGRMSSAAFNKLVDR